MMHQHGMYFIFPDWKIFRSARELIMLKTDTFFCYLSLSVRLNEKTTLTQTTVLLKKFNFRNSYLVSHGAVEQFSLLDEIKPQLFNLTRIFIEEQ